MSLGGRQKRLGRDASTVLGTSTDVLEPLQHFHIEVKVMISDEQQQARCMTGIGNEACKPR